MSGRGCWPTSRSELARLTAVLDALQELARGDARVTESFAGVDLAELADAAVDSLRARHPEAGGRARGARRRRRAHGLRHRSPARARQPLGERLPPRRLARARGDRAGERRRPRGGGRRRARHPGRAARPRVRALLAPRPERRLRLGPGDRRPAGAAARRRGRAEVSPLGVARSWWICAVPRRGVRQGCRRDPVARAPADSPAGLYAGPARWTTRWRPSPTTERAALAPHFTNLDRPVFALVNLPETVQGRALRPLLALPRHAAAALPRRVRRRPRGRGGASVRRPGGRARPRALRADLPRLRRRLRRAARRRPHRLRVGLERDDQAAPARPSGRLPRAVHPLHPLRRADAVGRLPLLARSRRSAPSTSRRWTSSSTPTRRACRG